MLGGVGLEGILIALPTCVCVRALGASTCVRKVRLSKWVKNIDSLRPFDSLRNRVPAARHEWHAGDLGSKCGEVVREYPKFCWKYLPQHPYLAHHSGVADGLEKLWNFPNLTESRVFTSAGTSPAARSAMPASPSSATTFQSPCMPPLRQHQMLVS